MVWKLGKTCALCELVKRVKFLIMGVEKIFSNKNLIHWANVLVVRHFWKNKLQNISWVTGKGGGREALQFTYPHNTQLTSEQLKSVDNLQLLKTMFSYCQTHL